MAEVKDEAEPGADAAGPSSENQAGDAQPVDDEALKEFYQEVRAVDRDNEVNRILGAFKLNPFEQLGLRYDATQDDAKKQYRKVSLLVHPDKCSHPRAKDAFEVLGNAYKIFQDEDQIKEVLHTLNLARDEVRKEWRKKLKHDSATRIASLLHDEGKEGVLAAFESSDQFHEDWKAKSTEMLARGEWRRRKLTKRLKEEEARIEEDEADTRKRMKETREHSKKWEENREGRVGTWRDFVKKKTDKKKGPQPVGGLKPPKQKTWDEDKTYIQRPVGEQFRPPPQRTGHNTQRG